MGAFGGGRSTGFGLIYDNLDALKKYEPRWRQIRYGFADARSRSRKAYKELKKKIRTTWGTGRRARLRKERRPPSDCTMLSSPGDGDAVPASGLPWGAAVGVAGDAVVSRLIWVLWHGFSNSDERVA